MPQWVGKNPKTGDYFERGRGIHIRLLFSTWPTGIRKNSRSGITSQSENRRRDIAMMAMVAIQHHARTITMNISMVRGKMRKKMKINTNVEQFSNVFSPKRWLVAIFGCYFIERGRGEQLCCDIKHVSLCLCGKRETLSPLWNTYLCVDAAF